MVYVVDTHALVWYLERSEELGHEARAIMDDETCKLIIPTIVLAEVKYLAARRRIDLSLDEVMEALEEDPRCVLYPLHASVVRVMPVVRDIHDGIICGTALVYQDLFGEGAKVITKDEGLKASCAVETVW